jgi:hypothetical protein
MRTKSVFFALGLVLMLLGSQAANAQISVNIGGYYGPPRAYYGPRYYYPPRPAVVYAPPPVVVVPAPYYAPRPVYYAPRPYYGYRGGRGWGHGGRRW